ncbi:hypothetical protein [Paenibacillus sp. P46E]|uniref:hypothetical protein n=1 Tax=Paenibacillus sp. P46E TaxID=1349436 RepID=UPI00093ABD68|nr:hypothetical protein [Paenibacillus sp. P46E]OKP97748.1 hypothetical protein A3849_13660 [Paenibacillus sp. P46E]
MKQTNEMRHIRYFFYKHGANAQQVSRKTKKYILGPKMTKRALKERLSAVIVTKSKYPEPADISDEFCPNCGCESSKTTGNMAEYPEVWVKETCLRCGFLVGMADNSSWDYALEHPEENYRLD